MPRLTRDWLPLTACYGTSRDAFSRGALWTAGGFEYRGDYRMADRFACRFFPMWRAAWVREERDAVLSVAPVDRAWYWTLPVEIDPPRPGDL